MFSPNEGTHLTSGHAGPQLCNSGWGRVSENPWWKQTIRSVTSSMKLNSKIDFPEVRRGPHFANCCQNLIHSVAVISDYKNVLNIYKMHSFLSFELQLEAEVWKRTFTNQFHNFWTQSLIKIYFCNSKLRPLSFCHIQDESCWIETSSEISCSFWVNFGKRRREGVTSELQFLEKRHITRHTDQSARLCCNCSQSRRCNRTDFTRLLLVLFIFLLNICAIKLCLNALNQRSVQVKSTSRTYLIHVFFMRQPSVHMKLEQFLCLDD